jgi:hypothetical protein
MLKIYYILKIDLFIVLHVELNITDLKLLFYSFVHLFFFFFSPPSHTANSTKKLACLLNKSTFSQV